MVYKALLFVNFTEILHDERSIWLDAIKDTTSLCLLFVLLKLQYNRQDILKIITLAIWLPRFQQRM